MAYGSPCSPLPPGDTQAALDSASFSSQWRYFESPQSLWPRLWCPEGQYAEWGQLFAMPIDVAGEWQVGPRGEAGLAAVAGWSGGAGPRAGTHGRLACLGDRACSHAWQAAEPAPSRTRRHHTTPVRALFSVAPPGGADGGGEPADTSFLFTPATLGLFFVAALCFLCLTYGVAAPTGGPLMD